MKTLNKISKIDLAEFAEICNSLFGGDKTAFINEVNLIYKWHNNGTIPEKIQEIQNFWYNSLQGDRADYSVYDNIFYLADCFACWKLYSRNYIRSILSDKALASKDSHLNFYNLKSIRQHIGPAKTVIDVGCGIGYSTLALQEIFNESSVYGTNLKDTKQWEICKKIGVNLLEDVSKMQEVDLIVAFEYFEHFEDPIEHLKYLINTASPRFLLIANSFGTISIGHFIYQTYNGEKVASKGFGRIFNNELRNLGFRNVKTNIFNNKPSFWEKI